MKRRLILFIVLTILLMPFVVKATEIKEITKSDPQYLEVDKGSQGIDKFFVANGTPIVISEVDDKTVVTWGTSGEKEIPNDTVVIGGALNPCTTGEVCNINFESTSITMTGGTVKTIIGGSEITKDQNYNLYLSSKVGTVNINITGGNVTKAIFGLASGSIAVPTSLLNTLGANYVATNVKVNVENANVARIIGTSSYTNIGTFEVNLKDSKITDKVAGLSGSSNGHVDSVIFTAENSEIATVSTGFRSMVKDYKLILKGTTTVTEIYAGSYYAAGEQSTIWFPSGSTWGIGDIDYGQAGKIEITIEEGVTYGNIYAGFQFVDIDKFLTKFEGNAALGTTIKFIEGSKNAPVILNIGSSPTVTDSGLESLINSSRANVTTNIIKKAELPKIDTSKAVTEPTMGVSDPEKAEEVLQKEISNSEKALKAISEGKEINIALEVKTIESTDEVKENVEKLVSNGVILGFFDISVLLKDNTNAVIDEVTTLENPIALSILLPEAVTPVEDGYNRTYYIVREHEGKYELLEATISEDGKTIFFATDKFSNYTLTYVDNKVEENPKTSDSILLAIGIATVSFLGLGTCLVYKRNRY